MQATAPVATITPMTSDTFSAVFFYVDGIPTKGLWFNFDDNELTSELVAEALSAQYVDCSVDEVLVSDAQGFADYFHSCECFDWDGWQTFTEELALTSLDREVVMAYFENCGQTDLDTIEEAYSGEHNSDLDFAQQMGDDIGLLDGMDDSLKYYFDWESWARDLMISDYFESNGHYFRNL